MTVKELIERLKDFDGNLPVTVDSDSVELYSFRIEDVALSNERAENDCVALYGNPTE
jgi:hypothetical protein